MPVKDRIVTWFIQHVLLPRIEIIDKPGFVINTLSDNRKTTFLREFFLPEKLFEIIEKNIIKEYGDLGKETLYSIGKKFGYIYAAMSEFPTINTHKKKEMTDFVYYMVKYLETFYASHADYEVDIDKKILTISFKDYIICRNNGLGYIMADGGSVGIWAYLMQDKTLEATQLKCQGRGDTECVIICAPKNKIRDVKGNYFIEEQLDEMKYENNYLTLNEVRETIYARNSMKDLIDINFFEYSKGIVSYKQNRFFSCDSHILYVLENEIQRLPEGERILFDSCFEYGRILQKIYGYPDYAKFIIDFFPAIGFGDVMVNDSQGFKITSVYYPWTTFSEKAKYTIFRGILSGFISASLNMNILFKNFTIDIGEYLTLTISE
ncbi:MAG: hypothetical protein QXL17_00510 [Candidatus Thermoplasmatota archaeon]